MHNTSFNHRFRTVGADKYPDGAGDRYWAQDLARDHRYLQGLPARCLLDMFASVSSVLLSGGVVTEGSDKGKVNIAAAVGLVRFAVDVASDSVWAVPAAVASQDIVVAARLTAQTDAVLGGTLNNVATNYVKLRFAEANNAAARARKYEGGSFYYAKTDSFTVVADAVAPTAYDVLLATYVGDGTTTLTITQVLPAVGSAATASSLMRRDSAGRASVAEPSAATDIAVLKTVTDHNAVTNPHSAASAATADRLILRDASGRAAVANPSADGDIANKGWVNTTIAAYAAKVTVTAVDLGTRTTDYTLPALAVGELCFLRVYGYNNKGNTIQGYMPASGYRILNSAYGEDSTSGNTDVANQAYILKTNSVDEQTATPCCVVGASTANYFTAEICYYRVS